MSDNISDYIGEYGTPYSYGNWIENKEESLPPTGEKLFVSNEKGANFFTLSLSSDRKMWYCGHSDFTIPNEQITHWMPPPPVRTKVTPKNINTSVNKMIEEGLLIDDDF